MKRYVAQPGDYLAKIATEHGTTVSAIWNHPANAEHRAKRKSPDVLYAGDVLWIPVADDDPASPPDDPPDDPLPHDDPLPPDGPMPPELPPLPPPGLGLMRPLVIRQGDYVDRLAFVHGFDANAVWNAPDNEELRKERVYPYILYPGDILYVPALPGAPAAITANSSNHFVAAVPTTSVHLTFEYEGVPLAGQAYTLVGLPPPHDAPDHTDGTGSVTLTVPVTIASFEIHFPETGLVYPVRIAEIDPIKTYSGILKRLRSLGYAYLPPREDLDAWEEADDKTVQRHELLNYQEQRGLPQTGELDPLTEQALASEYGC
jgi:hypothetical protein